MRLQAEKRDAARLLSHLTNKLEAHLRTRAALGAVPCALEPLAETRPRDLADLAAAHEEALDLLDELLRSRQADGEALVQANKALEGERNQRDHLHRMLQEAAARYSQMACHAEGLQEQLAAARHELTSAQQQLSNKERQVGESARREADAHALVKERTCSVAALEAALEASKERVYELELELCSAQDKAQAAVDQSRAAADVSARQQASFKRLYEWAAQLRASHSAHLARTTAAHRRTRKALEASDADRKAAVAQLREARALIVKLNTAAAAAACEQRASENMRSKRLMAVVTTTTTSTSIKAAPSADGIPVTALAIAEPTLPLEPASPECHTPVRPPAADVVFYSDDPDEEEARLMAELFDPAEADAIVRTNDSRRARTSACGAAELLAATERVAADALAASAQLRAELDSGRQEMVRLQAAVNAANKA